MIYSKILKPINNEFVPLTNNEIREIEDFVKIKLPTEYQSFIIKYGYSSFSELTSVYLKDDYKFPICLFYGGKNAKHHLLKIIQTYIGRMPSTMIPIASDLFGNQFCIGISGNDYGAIYFWDHELEPDPDDYLEDGEEVPENIWYENITKIADSFNQFFELLKPSH